MNIISVMVNNKRKNLRLIREKYIKFKRSEKTPFYYNIKSDLIWKWKVM